MSSITTPYVSTYRGSQLQRTSPLSLLNKVTHGAYDGVEVRGTDTVIPSATGQLARNRLAHRRTIEAELYIFGDDEEDGADLKYELATLFDKTLFPDDLVVVLANGSTLTLNARVIDLSTDGEAMPDYGLWIVTWEAVQPTWQVSGS